MTEIQEYVVEQFGADAVQESYRETAEDGLWPSEEAVIDTYFPDGSRVLDLGCGTGRTTIPLAKAGYDVVGVDITPEMIEHAREIAYENGIDIDYQIGDATDLEFAERSFDRVLFSNQGWTQIPGSEKRRTALEEIHRVLAPGGIFVFTTHVRQWRGYALFWMKQWLKIRVLKPLGFDVREQEFGDRFFESSNTDISFPEGQYIHIPKVEDVIEIVEDEGFEVVEAARAKELAADEEHPSNPMFYICRKQ